MTSRSDRTAPATLPAQGSRPARDKGKGPTSEPLFARLVAFALGLTPVRAYLRYAQNKGPQLADSVTYRTLFGIFAGALLGLSFAVLWFAGNPTAFRALLDAVDNAIPGLTDLIDLSEISSLSVGFSVAGILSLVGLIMAALGAVGSLRIAVRTVAGKITDDGVWWAVMLRNLALAIGIGVALLAAAATTFYGTAGVGFVADIFGLSRDNALIDAGSRAVAVIVTFALDTVIVAVVFRVLSGVRATALSLWTGAVLGGVGLTALQQLSGYVVGGASANPLLASFASLIALLLWLNFSVQVILIAVAFVTVKTEEAHDRVRARHGARTFAQYRVQRAEDGVAVATAELRAARSDEERERTGSA